MRRWVSRACGRIVDVDDGSPSVLPPGDRRAAGDDVGRVGADVERARLGAPCCGDDGRAGVRAKRAGEEQRPHPSSRWAALEDQRVGD